jgi:NAD(P)H-hydrate epimerase
MPVLAVDVPSGLDALTGVSSSGAVRATVTVTFQALKSGILLADGPEHSGEVRVVDLDIALGDVSGHLIEDTDVAERVAVRGRDAHKWQRAVFVCAGSPGMFGAALLSASGAMRAGSGMVRLGVPGGVGERSVPSELVEEPLPVTGFGGEVLGSLDRCKALVVGPGLGRTPAVTRSVVEILQGAEIPVVLDADGIVALGSLADASALLGRRPGLTVLTPHDGEYERLTGEPPGRDRVASVRALAETTRTTVLLKGSTTIVADPSGAVRFVNAGSPALATAGTGDVLSGVIAAFIARGVAPLDAAALGAHVHGRAASLGLRDGLLSGDLPLLIATILSAR